MALPATAANAGQVESGARASARPASPLSSGLPTYNSVPQSGRPAASSQQQSSSLPRQSLDLGVPQQSDQNSVNEGGKEATTHDFLSLHGSGSASSTETTAARGLTSSVTTQDFLHPLEKATKPTSSGLFSQGLVTGASRVHTSSADYATGPQTSFALVNGTLELPSSVLYRVDRGEAVAEGMKERLENLAQWSSMPLKFRPSDVSYAPKAHVPQAVPLMNKQWQQQQVSSDFFDASKRPPRAPSEDDDDDDDEESVDRGHIPKKENLHQKCDTSQKLEGKSNDYRGNTPRSKHSATEQRRRSKINDRFQMLRQLVANSDQKRDKASFLLEVIDYIQMLQEKLRKYEAAEHGRQQETLKTIPWDVFQRNPGCRDSPTDAPRVPSVPNVSFDSKQVPDSNGYVMPRSNESEVSGPELMRGIGQVSAISDRSAQIPQAHHSSYESKATICKPVAVTLSAQPPALPTFGSCAHVFHSVPQSTTEAHAIFSQLHYHEEQAVSPFSEAKGSLYNKVEAASLPQLHGNNLVSPKNMNNVTELDHEKATIPEQSVQKLNHGNSDEELKLVKSTQGQHPTEKSSFLREGEKDDSSPAHGIDDSKAEQKCEVQADEQEPLIIQGGVISVSSLYSQGLLDTLTRALQSSGLDLRQAMISVQIDLGNPSGSVVASSRKTATLSTGISQRPNGEAGTSLEFEHPSKKPKIEVDS